MKVVRWIINKIMALWEGCFYLFSAFTLVMMGMFVLTIAFGIFNIHGLKEKVILYAYLSMVGIYAVVKTVMWFINVYKKIMNLYKRFFKHQSEFDCPQDTSNGGGQYKNHEIPRKKTIYNNTANHHGKTVADIHKIRR